MLISLLYRADGEDDFWVKRKPQFGQHFQQKRFCFAETCTGFTSFPKIQILVHFNGFSTMFAAYNEPYKVIQNCVNVTERP